MASDAMAGQRGPRRIGRLDFATASWQRNEHGVDVLVLSQDAVSGALTLALRTPAGMRYPEKEHFYDCDQDLFQFEGEFHHDEELPLHAGDYVWRPAGTVYGHSEGSAGGIIVASLGRQPRRYHLDQHPYPWEGHYRVDRLWSDRPDPVVVRAGEVQWESVLGCRICRLRGQPGQPDPLRGASRHSPWAADSAFLLEVPAGHGGPFPAWPDTLLETLVLAGQARVGGESWFRGCYAFDGLGGPCQVQETLTVYCRAFQR